MLAIEEIKEYLKSNLKESRYKHTLGVAECAVKLAELNDISTEKAQIAGLAHDVAKNMSKDEMTEIINKNNIKLSEVEAENFNLWHSVLAPVVAKNKLGICDEEILNAIRWHTTGNEEMSVLDKIIYIADMIEPSRDFDGIEELRKETFNDLNKGVFLGLTRSIEYLLTKNLLIDENTIKARNSFILKKLI